MDEVEAARLLPNVSRRDCDPSDEVGHAPQSPDEAGVMREGLGIDGRSRRGDSVEAPESGGGDLRYRRVDLGRVREEIRCRSSHAHQVVDLPDELRRDPGVMRPVVKTRNVVRSRQRTSAPRNYGL